MGLEVSGEVVATGATAKRWQVGDKVCALTNGGGYAEYVTINAGQCLPIPQGVSLVDAAGLPETFFTVWSNVFHGHDIPEGAVLPVTAVPAVSARQPSSWARPWGCVFLPLPVAPQRAVCDRPRCRTCD